MKSKLLAGILATSSLFAQPPVPPAESVNPPVPPAPRYERSHHRHVRGIKGLEWINLTEEQINEINKIDYDYETKIREAEYRKSVVDYKFRYEREKIDIDLNVVKDLINQKKDIEKEIDYLRIEKEVSILNVLTPEQREQLSYRRYR